MIPPQGFGETGENKRNKKKQMLIFLGGQRNKDESGEQWI